MKSRTLNLIAVMFAVGFIACSSDHSQSPAPQTPKDKDNGPSIMGPNTITPGAATGNNLNQSSSSNSVTTTSGTTSTKTSQQPSARPTAEPQPQSDNPILKIADWVRNNKQGVEDYNGDMWFEGKDMNGKDCNLDMRLRESGQSLRLVISLNEVALGVGEQESAWMLATKDAGTAENEFHTFLAHSQEYDSAQQPFSYNAKTEDITVGKDGFGFSYVSSDAEKSLEGTTKRNKNHKLIDVRLELTFQPNTGHLIRVDSFDLKSADPKKPLRTCFYK
jgi:hypothetical protein